MLEKDIERYLTREVKKMGGLCLKFTSPGNAGVPDRLILLPDGRVWFVEVKKPGGRVRPLQKWWQNNLADMGFPSLIIDSMHSAQIFITLIREARHEV